MSIDQCAQLSRLKTRAVTSFKFGPIQEEWLVAMETHPERQAKRYLGEGLLKYEEYTSCALGELHIQGCKFTGDNPFRGRVIDDDSSSCLTKSYNKYGLVGSIGNFIKPINYKNRDFTSIAQLNDAGVTFPEIAQIIRENPEKIFNKSV